MIRIVDKIISLLNEGKPELSNEIYELEETLNKKVYDIYGLTKNEIELISKEGD